MKKLLCYFGFFQSMVTIAEPLSTILPVPQLQVGHYNMPLSFEGGGQFLDELIVESIELKENMNFMGKYYDSCAYLYGTLNAVSYAVKGKVVSPGLFSVPIQSEGNCILISATEQIINLHFRLDEGDGEKKYYLDLRHSHDMDSIFKTKGTLYMFNGFTYSAIGTFGLEKKNEPRD